MTLSRELPRQGFTTQPFGTELYAREAVAICGRRGNVCMHTEAYRGRLGIPMFAFHYGGAETAGSNHIRR